MKGGKAWWCGQMDAQTSGEGPKDIKKDAASPAQEEGRDAGEAVLRRGPTPGGSKGEKAKTGALGLTFEGK